METLKQKLSQAPKNFWIYNYMASLLFFLIRDNFSVPNLFLFPIALIIAEYLIKTFSMEKGLLQYLGFYPLAKDDLPRLLITLIVSFILWNTSFWLVALGLIFIILKENDKI